VARPRSILSRLFIAAVLLGLIACALIIVSPGKPGISQQNIAVPDWLAQRIAGLVNTNLRPQLEFESLSYAPPFAITLTNAALVTPEGDRIIQVARLGIKLAEKPTKNQPLRIESVSFGDGVIRLLPIPGQGLAGFSRMRPDKTTPSNTKSASTADTSFSDVLELNRVDLSGFALEYTTADGQVIRLDGIAATLDFAPIPGETGWYAIGFDSGRAPGLELGFVGRLNLDTLALEVASLDATIDAGPQTLGTLPAPVASILTRHDITGRLSLTGSALCDLRRIAESTASFLLVAESINAAFGEYKLPVERLIANATLAGGRLNLDDFTTDLHGGTVEASGAATLTETGIPFEISWSASSVDLEQFLRTATRDGAPPKLAGLLSGNGRVTSALRSLRSSIAGSGSVNVEKGRLLMIPGLTQLSNLVNSSGLKDDTSSNHRGAAMFTLGPEGATITESEIITNTMASRGTGLVGFDKTLDLRINAGPLEKLQSLFGPIGDLLGSITDRLLKYTIKGTFAEPEVGVAPFGID